MRNIDDVGGNGAEGWKQLSEIVKCCWDKEAKWRPDIHTVHTMLDKLFKGQEGSLPAMRDIGGVVKAADPKQNNK